MTHKSMLQGCSNETLHHKRGSRQTGDSPRNFAAMDCREKDSSAGITEHRRRIVSPVDGAGHRTRRESNRAQKGETMNGEQQCKRGKRGQGCIYLPKNSRNYWIKFSMNGRVYQETANTESKNAALDFLRTRIGEVSSGKFVDCKRVTVQTLKDNMMKAWEL